MAPTRLLVTNGLLITKAFEKKTNVTGRLLQKTRGGYIVSILGILAFCPGSQLSTRPLKDFEITSMMKKALLRQRIYQ